MQNKAFPANGNAPEPTTRQPDTWAAEKSREKLVSEPTVIEIIKESFVNYL